MLVLSRKPGEALVIGDQITLRVISVRGRTVKVGVEAPPHVHVRRQELEPLKDQKSAGLQQPTEGREWIELEVPLSALS